MNVSKTLIALATATALVGGGVAIAQTDPAQPAPNTTGQPGNALGNSDGTPAADTSSTMSAQPTTPADTSVDTSAAPEPRADRN
jgi:hypothetical protein